ncbi:hypothetical protein [uncultured Flavobacterium sp.]|uniref:hypothetical protein n=1 Tax=uncultured Flavobacterium sp. TaxID=165435 RepID=UPI0030EE3B70|tara:strand:+ start:141 stop:1049 length:909 start_codon:yes stop_codon:yes gene_type:complete
MKVSLKNLCVAVPLAFLFSCSTHKKSNIVANEEFIVELKKPVSRGAIDLALQGLFLGANYFAEKTSKSLSNNYTKSISINDYYNTDTGEVEKTYNQIHIKKYSKPTDKEKKGTLASEIKTEYQAIPKSRGANASLMLSEVIRDEKDDLLNFHAVIELKSDPENPGVTRLSFNELRILFSKTRIYSDENLNAKVSIAIEGQWRSTDGSPMTKMLIEQAYEFRNLKYGYHNQINDPILSPWYYDIPITSAIENNGKFGVINVTIQVEEFEGGKSKYINKLPGILSDNKSKIVKDGASVIEKVMK